ncbi:MAG: bile acid:sodium symporter family protein [Paludibacter sp.]|nr:bile acid:sodium symporter family protein [Paludibacter sp.]
MYEALQQLDPIRINFSASGMHLINLVLCFVMFGVALNIQPGQFSKLIKNPKLPLIGLFSQLVALPAVTFVLVIALNSYITPTVAMGMILVAACPGGNISNFMTSYSKANTELAVGLTATSTIFATITTPFNFAFWGGLYVKYISNHAGHMLKPLTIDTWQMFETVFLLLGIPLIIGIFFSRKFPKMTGKIKKPIQSVSFVFFIAMVVLAFANNWSFFLKYIYFIFILVLIHNTLALVTGFSIGTLFKVSNVNRRTLTIETGIHNSGLGLLLLFNPKIFPPELQIGGMIFIVAWWGIWHIVSGLSIATYWHNKEPKE